MTIRYLIASFLFCISGILIMGSICHDLFPLKIAGGLLIIGAYGLHEGV